MRATIATFAAMPPGFTDDDQRIAGGLRARGIETEVVPWDDPHADWDSLDAVVIRSTWDYAGRRDEFLAWADRIGARLHNSPGVIRWNSDKRYMGDLAAAGFAVVHTSYAEPGDGPPHLDGEVVVKPTVSAGGRDTGRFGKGAHAEALALVERIQASGRAAMIQPYQESVDSVGETAIVCLNGEPSYALRKHAILRPDEVAPVRDDGIGAAEVMYDPGLVVAGEATAAELRAARAIVTHVAERFGYTPLCARVDMVPSGADGSPTLMELEAIEPNLYLSQVPEALERVVAGIAARL